MNENRPTTDAIVANSQANSLDGQALKSAMRRPFNFRVLHLLYATAVVSASVVSNGPPGLLLAVLILGWWFYIGWFRKAAVWDLAALLSAVIFFWGLVNPLFSVHEHGTTDLHCANKMKMIGLGLHNYHDTYGCFPPAYITDELGRPMHSWRVLILPFIEQQPLYNAYRFDEPWDGPNNSQLHSQRVYTFNCPDAPRNSTDTSYLAVVGPETAWPADKCQSLSGIPESHGTVMVIERNGSGIHWMEPRDLTIDEAMEVCSLEKYRESGHQGERQLFSNPGGRNMLRVDGGVILCEPQPSQAELARLFSTELSGGLSYDKDLDAVRRSQALSEAGQVISTCILFLLLVLPVIYSFFTRMRGAARVE